MDLDCSGFFVEIVLLSKNIREITYYPTISHMITNTYQAKWINFKVSYQFQSASKADAIFGISECLDFELWTLDAGLSTLDAGGYTLDDTRWTMGSGHWTLSLAVLNKIRSQFLILVDKIIENSLGAYL